MRLIALSQVRPYLVAARSSHVILALGLRTARAISTHADRCLSVAWRAPSRRLPLSGIGPANDIPIARRRVARRQAEQFFE